MDIDSIRQCVAQGKYSITDHAFIESFKDGISFDEIIWAVNHGKIIEEYPERCRCLVFAVLPTRIYLHVVIDYFQKSEIDIVTVYIPDSKLWIRGYKRKR